MDRNYAFFLKADLGAYVDQWVAIVDGRVVAHGKNAKKVFDEAQSSFPGKPPLLARVPGTATMIL